MAIDHNRQVVHIATPYDDVIIRLNSKLNNTYVSYGAMGRQKKELQSVQDANAATLQEDVIVKRAVSKSSRLYKNSQWDLVDAAEADATVISELENEELPAELQGKSEKEIKAYIDQKKAEREDIQKQIQELNAKREAYIAEHQKEETGELENAMLSAIKAQASKKNYRWEN